MRALVTGFEPFDGEPINPSELLARALAARFEGRPGLRVAAAVLPVDRERLAAAFATARSRHEPGVTVLLGQATGRPTLDLEQQALNRFRLPGQEGGCPLDPRGPPALRSGLPLARICDDLERRGHPVRLSEDAGWRECNALYYTVLQSHADLPAVFVHVPLLPEQAQRRQLGEACLPEHAALEAVAALLEQLPRWMPPAT